MLEMLAGAAAIGEIVTAVLEVHSRIKLGDGGGNFGDISRKSISESMNSHLREVASWSETVQVDPKGTPRQLRDLYVDLSLDLRDESGNAFRDLSVSDLAAAPQNVAILGQPGSGKTTSLKHIAQRVLTATGVGPRWFPVLVNLRHLNGKSLYVHIARSAGLLSAKLPSEFHAAVAEQAVPEFAKSISMLLLLDGLDEAPLQDRGRVAGEVQRLLQSVPSARVILTSRPAEYRITINKLRVLSVAGLNPDQRKELALRWLRNDVEVHDFLGKVDATPYAGAEIRPLTFAVLALLYLRRRDVPEYPRTVYNKLLRLFLEDWDDSKDVRRESVYGSFTVDRKEAFLEAIAYQLLSIGARGDFSHAELLQCYREVHDRYGLPEGAASGVLREVESHTGLIIESGPGEFSFFHLTIQEYLGARHLIARGSLELAGIKLEDHPHLLAVATALSTAPELFLANMLVAIRRRDQADQATLWEPVFVAAYLERLVDEKPDWKAGPLLLYSLVHLLDWFSRSELLLEPKRIVVLERILSHPAIKTSYETHFHELFISAPARQRSSSNDSDDFELFRLSGKATGIRDLQVVIRLLPVTDELRIPSAFFAAVAMSNKRPAGPVDQPTEVLRRP